MPRLAERRAACDICVIDRDRTRKRVVARALCWHCEISLVIWSLTEKDSDCVRDHSPRSETNTNIKNFIITNCAPLIIT